MRFGIVLLVVGLLACNVLANRVNSKFLADQDQPQTLDNGLPDKEGQYELRDIENYQPGNDGDGQNELQEEDGQQLEIDGDGQNELQEEDGQQLEEEGDRHPKGLISRLLIDLN